MNHFKSSLTQLCEDSIPTGPRDYINKDSKLAYNNAIIQILKDAAGIPRNTEFDPKFITYERLMVRSKLQLADLVHQLCWFLSAKAAPIVEVAWRQMQVMQGEAEKRKEEASVREKDEVLRLQGLLLKCQREVNELQSRLLKEREGARSVIQKNCVDQKGEDKPSTSPSPPTTNSPTSPVPMQSPRNSSGSATTSLHRSQNLIIYGVIEAEPESDVGCKEAALNILNHTGIDADIVSVQRLGEQTPGTSCHRPIRMVLHSRQVVRSILERSVKLRSVQGCERVYLCPDRSVEEREKRKELVRVLGVKKKRESDKKWVIRRGQVVNVMAD